MNADELGRFYSEWPIAEIIGKTICGVVVKKNPHGRNPFEQVFLVFDDDTSCELYSEHEIQLNAGVYPRNLDGVRQYISPPLGPMEILLDASLDKEDQLKVDVNKRLRSIL